MPPKKKKDTSVSRRTNANAVIENAGIIIEQKITETIEKNFMPYAMSVIVSRAIPEIDGFKPSHRKLLYTMYKMGLLNGARTKCANIVGQTMRLNPHGDSAIYETMVRLSRGNETLLHAYVDSKGNFGKAYSRDMAYAASRYTEAKLSPISAALFADIDSDTVDFVDNYDSTMKEPTLFPVSFPSVLVNSNIGIAVGMASSVSSFNLAEVCETTIAKIRNKNHDVISTLKAPDFSGGGYIVYDEATLQKIYETGRGGVKVRARWTHDKNSGCIDITEIPPSTTVEAIMDKTADLVRKGQLREVADMRDETDLGGLKITIDLRRGTDPEKLMQKLFRVTPLEDSFSCNFNILVAGTPRVMGVSEIIDEWTAFRRECVRRRTFHELAKKKDKLHLLLGLAKILLDIDKAIRIVRETDEDAEVIPNLMIGFGIDQVQAEYVSEIRLRHLNREYILNRTKETDKLKEEIADLQDVLDDASRVDAIIVAELREVAKKYGQPRKSMLYYPTQQDNEPVQEEVPDYPVHIFLTKEGYLKKITPQSLRMSAEQKLKEGDEISQSFESSNAAQLLFFTNKQQVYKADAADFAEQKASVMGDYIPARLGMDEGEMPIYLVVTKDYAGWMIFCFENGKVAKVELSGYQTKTKRKKLLAAYSDNSPLVCISAITEDREYLMRATNNRTLIFHSGALNPKSTKSTQGVQVMSLRKGLSIVIAVEFSEGMLVNSHRFRTKTLPASGSFPRPEDEGEEQLTL